MPVASKDPWTNTTPTKKRQCPPRNTTTERVAGLIMSQLPGRTPQTVHLVVSLRLTLILIR